MTDGRNVFLKRCMRREKISNTVWEFYWSECLPINLFSISHPKCPVLRLFRIVHLRWVINGSSAQGLFLFFLWTRTERGRVLGSQRESYFTPRLVLGNTKQDKQGGTSEWTEAWSWVGRARRPSRGVLETRKEDSTCVPQGVRSLWTGVDGRKRVGRGRTGKVRSIPEWGPIQWHGRPPDAPRKTWLKCCRWTDGRGFQSRGFHPRSVKN